MQKGQQRLPGAERLGKTDISQIFDHGGSGKGSYFIVRARSNGLTGCRMAPIVGKKAGKANIRNRIKRLVRLLYRTNKDKFPAGFDLLFIARAGVDKAAQADLLAAMVKAAQSAATDPTSSRPLPPVPRLPRLPHGSRRCSEGSPRPALQPRVVCARWLVFLVACPASWH